jgi:peptidoglycan hydrolase-like protein with peptidoglycan-binding domain
MFYRNRYSVPNYYWGRGYDRPYSGRSTEVAVQRELYRMGYYRGPIDGDIGPGTSRAIARFERARGLPVRGFISRTLLDALGLI